MTKKTFAELGLSPTIVAAIEKKGFKEPSPIQVGVIPLLLQGDKDIIGQAQTGTGKTAAFALPLLERLDASKKQIQAVVLVPTRELAVQVAKEIQSFAVPKSPTVTVVYGGNQMWGEVKALKNNPTIVVGTPGRMQHHIRNKNLRLEHIRYFVLDEADEMLNFGFREEIEEILKQTPPERRVLLFSATMPVSIMNIVKNYMGNHDTIKDAAKETGNTDITHKYYCVRPDNKFEALCRIMESEESFYAIIFCRTKIETDLVASQLASKNLRAEAIHGDIDQSQREKILARFRQRKTNILVATDVAARGIDINELNFVVNYNIPIGLNDYTHRIGRTGRAGNKGTAITLVSNREAGKLRSFERNLKVKIEQGVLPTPKDLIAKKQRQLIQRLEHIMNNENIEHLLPIAELLLEEGKPAEVVATLLQDFYKNDFDAKNYRVIPDAPVGTGGGYAGGSSIRRSGGYKGRGPVRGASPSFGKPSFAKPSSVRKRASNGRPRTEFKKASATGYKGKTFAKAKPDFKDGGGSFGKAKPGFKKKRSGFKKG